MGAGSELTQFKPGQSGNPEGSSKKAKRRKLLRECLWAFLDGKVPEDIRDQLPAVLQDLNGSEIIARELFTQAIVGEKSADRIKAIATMLGTEPKVVDMTVRDESDSPVYLEPPEERRSEIEDLLPKAADLLQ